jgi:hypothetical protein
MKHIDRLIIKAKKTCGITELRFSLGMVYPIDGDKWVARGQLWNYIPCGKPGHRLEIATCTCNSVEDAIEALEQLSEEYPNKEDVPILTMDYGEGD